VEDKFMQYPYDKKCLCCRLFTNLHPSVMKILPFGNWNGATTIRRLLLKWLKMEPVREGKPIEARLIASSSNV